MSDELIVGLVFLGPTILLTLVALIWHDMNKPRQHDWVADQKRRISDRGYKARMGAR